MKDKNRACMSANCQHTYIDDGKHPSYLACTDGPSTCFPAKSLSEAHPSAFHTQELIDATQKINKILSEIPEHSEDGKLSLVQTPTGLLLVWVHHGREFHAVTGKEKIVTGNDSPETIAQALKLKHWELTEK